MRKNFTQLFLGLTLVLGFMTQGYSQCDVDPPPGAIYNYQFDGGLDGWRTLDVAGFETTIGWIWSDIGDLSMGAYGPEAGTVLGSESQCNGAMVFDSDFLDNNGVQGNFGAGPCPSPCTGYLRSPVMDFSAVGADVELEISYFQAVRQFQSEYYIYISLDGGITNADTIEVNTLKRLNANLVQEFIRIPFCDYVNLNGESNVVITFGYIGDYYVWALDDVTIGESNEVDLRVNENFYSKIPNYVTPRNMGTDIPFLADIQNMTEFDSPESKMNYNIRNEDGDVIYTTSRDYQAVPACDLDMNKLADDTYTMPDEVGSYRIEYDLEVENDPTPRDNVVSSPFRISRDEFRKLPTAEEFGSTYFSGVRFGSGYVSWGSYFYIPRNPDQQAIDSVYFGLFAGQGDTPNPGIIEVSVYQWLDLNEDGDAQEEEKLTLGTGQHFIEQGGESFVEFGVKPLTPAGQPIVPAAGSELLVVAHSAPFSGETNYFFTCVNLFDDARFLQFAYDATNFAHRQAGIIGGYGSYASQDGSSSTDKDTRLLFNLDGYNTDGDQYIYDVSMKLTPPLSSEEINDDLSIDIYPSPASEKINVELNLEDLSKKVSIELTDMSGNRAGMYNFSNIKNDRLTIDVADLPGGMYLLNIRTEAGMTSKKVSVIH